MLPLCTPVFGVDQEPALLQGRGSGRAAMRRRQSHLWRKGVQMLPPPRNKEEVLAPLPEIQPI